MYKCQEELEHQFQLYQSILKGSCFSISVRLIRDYLLSLDILKDRNVVGIVNVHYSPNKKKFTLKNQTLLKEDFEEFNDAVDKKEKQENSLKDRNGLEKLEEYYKKISRYRNCFVDFEEFAEVLEIYYEKILGEKIELKKCSTDFDKLDLIYNKLMSKLDML